MRERVKREKRQKMSKRYLITHLFHQKDLARTKTCHRMKSLYGSFYSSVNLLCWSLFSVSRTFLSRFGRRNKSLHASISDSPALAILSNLGTHLNVYGIFCALQTIHWGFVCHYTSLISQDYSCVVCVLFSVCCRPSHNSLALPQLKGSGCIIY